MNRKMNTHEEEIKCNIERMEKDTELNNLSEQWFLRSMKDKYSYNFNWMGRPIIQYPQDIMAMQEIVWKVQPDLIIETGIAHGGSLIFYASLMELMYACGGADGHVLGIDIDIREHNRKAIEAHPMYKRITMYEGSSIDDDIVKRVYELAAHYNKVLVVLDSYHTGDHVYEECRKYSPLVKKGSYLVIMDTCCEMVYQNVDDSDIQASDWLERPWGVGNNPMTGMLKFMEECDRFEIDKQMDAKIQISCAPNGYLKCIKD